MNTNLTEREIKVINSLAEGLTPEEAGAKHGCDAKDALRGARKKLGAKSTTHLICLSVKHCHGLLSAPAFSERQVTLRIDSSACAVVRLIKAGYSYPEVAQEIGKTEKYVKAVIPEILAKDLNGRVKTIYQFFALIAWMRIAITDRSNKA